MRAKSKLPNKPTRIPGAFDTTIHKTERTAVAILMHWMRQIIEAKGLDLGMPDVETTGADRKLPDTVIYESRRSQRVLCVIEAKPPYYDVFDYEALKSPAWEKANQRKARYFALTNFKSLIWFNTEKVNAMRPEEEQIIARYGLSELEDLDLIEDIRYKNPILKGLDRFLTELYRVSSGQEPEPKLAIDSFLIFRLHEKVERLSRYYKGIIYDQFHKDSNFAKELKHWFTDQGWSFAEQEQDYNKAARQTAYLLVNKLLFYDLLQAKRPHELSRLEIPKGLVRGGQLQKILQSFFDEVLKIDYELIYTADFIDTLAFPDSREVVKEIVALVDILSQYDFSKLGYDVIGRIFEKLIPQEERHNLGQYFTNPDVVDLILKFCLAHEKDKIFDPACGAGTFLVRAYQHKKLMNQRLEHEAILDTLWGNDIAKFPAHLAIINLAINDLASDKNYPNILQEDFFTLLAQQDGFELPQSWRKARARTLRMEEREIEYPRWFDCVVGNPPYTRQEEIAKISPEATEYKRDLIRNALRDLRGRPMAEIGRRAGIHAYFFIHGTKFLRNHGRFGFIVSNSWLDVEYGKGLQEFFLKNYKIIAIIESKVERWFEAADINTCIVILEKCAGEANRKARDENLVRFVYLKKPLSHFIPPAQDIWEKWEKQLERLNEIDRLKRTILAHNQFYENEELRIFPKSQKELWEEGLHIDSSPSMGMHPHPSSTFKGEEKGGGEKYIGSKWGKYLRAPQIFFKILEKGKDKLVPLKEVAEVRFGIKTGANEFFYLTEEAIKRRGIEREFWMHPSPLSKEGKGGKGGFPLSNGGTEGSPLNKGGKGGFPLSKGGFDKTILKERGLITTGFHLPYNPKLKQTARLLRKNMTPAEKMIWYRYFRAFEYPVLRQKPIDNYVVDFYCPEYKLIVEIDGESHFTEEGKVYDEERTNILEQYGLKIIRFQNGDVLNNLEGVVDRIEQTIENLRRTRWNGSDQSPPPPFNKGGKGGFPLNNGSTGGSPLSKGGKGGFPLNNGSMGGSPLRKGGKGGSDNQQSPVKEGEVIAGAWKDKNGEYFKQSQYAKLYELKQILQKDGCIYWLPNYVIKSPRECKSIVVKPEDLKYRVLMIHKDRKTLRGTNILKYIQEGERKGYHLRPTCASRERWYDLGERGTAQILIPERFWDRFSIFGNYSSVLENKNLYGLTASLGDVAFLTAYLNSTPFVMSLELFSRGTLGQGVLDIDVWMVASIPTINPSKLSELENLKVEIALSKLSKLGTESIFSELGASSSEEVSLDKVKPDRRELDKIIMGEILGLTDEEQLEVYKAVVDLVKSRIEKAKSFGKRRKTKEGIDIDLLVKTVMDKLGEETLGKFYKEKILSQKSLRTRRLPKSAGEVRVEEDLYGWRLYSGKRYITCESELQARYLKVWLEAGFEKVKIPRDERYLKAVLPELESLKAKIDEIINSYLESILDPKTRARIEHQLWMEMVK